MRNEQIRMANRPKPKQSQTDGMPQTLKPKQSQAPGMPQTMKPKQDQTAGMPQTLKPKLTILVVVLTAFVTTFTGSALNLSIPDLSQEFHAGAGMVGWLVTGYTLAVAACSVPAGRVADITSLKSVLAIGVGLFTICCIAAVFSISIMMLILIRVVQGIGAAMIFSTNTAVLLKAFPAENHGRVIGYSLAATYAGLSSGPVLGGFLNQHFGWKAIFIVTGVITTAACIAVFRLPGDKNVKNLKTDSCGESHHPLTDTDLHGKTLQQLVRRKSNQQQDPEEPLTKPHSLDLTGNLLYLISIVLLMYGLSEIGKGWISPVLAGVGLAVGMFFLRHEYRTEEPAVDIRMFRENIGYGFSNLSALLNYGATFAISYLVSIYLQVVQGFSSQATGLIMIAQPAIMAGLSPVAGKLSDRFSPFKLSSIGMGLCALGTCLFVFLNQGTSLWIVITALIITGFGFALFSSPNTNAVMSCVEETNYGVASSILATMRSIGHTISMVIVTIIVTCCMGDASLAEASPGILIRVIRIAFIIFTGICIAGVFISLKRR